MNFSGQYDKVRQETVQQELEAAQQAFMEEDLVIGTSVPSKKRLSQEAPSLPSERIMNGQGTSLNSGSGKTLTPLEKITAQLSQVVSQTNGNVGQVPNRETIVNQQQLKVAERLARQLHELEKKKVDDLKRKRDEEEELYRSVRRKVEDQRVKLEEEERQVNQTSSKLYTIFNDLQGIAKDFNINFEYPEIVVVGMQSDGKSSFIEGLLGFQFNIVESNIGTRRPLIIQMINDQSKKDPLCRFRKENPSPSDNNPFEEIDTPVHKLLDEIIRRTNERAGTGDRVSAVPIILRVEYCHCANLTIYDTPGFRLGGEDIIKNDIQQMVMRLIEPKHRIIVCLEQSTVEWANTVSRPIVKSVDPDFSRTILVNTKFDNRVKELRNPESANKYMAGEALPRNTRPFFISMPLRRNMDSHRFKEMMKEAFLEDYQKLLEVGFDEKRFASQLGMFRVKSHLEKILFEKYQQSLSPTLRTLEELCKKTELELSQVKKELSQHDVDLLKNKATLFVRLFVRTIDQLLAGSIAGNPERSGETLVEEKMNSGADWPEFNIDFDVQGSKFKVYGGAQYARLLNEFEYVAHSREFPVTTPSEIASALGIAKWNGTALETAASNLVQIKAKQAFVPLIDIVLSRCSYIMKRLFPISINVLKTDKDSQGVGILSVYERFQNELRTTFEQIIDKIENDCRARLKDDFVMFTRMVDWDLLSASTAEPSDYNYLEPSNEDTKRRVSDIMQRSGGILGGSASGEDNYTRVAMMAAKMFASMRFFFVKYVRNKMNAFFLDPMQQEVGSFVINHFYKLTENKYEDMFLEGVEELKLLAVKLENQLEACTKQRDKFKETYMKMKHSSEEVFKKVGF